MWHLDWEIEAWFKKIQKKRDQQSGRTSNDDDVDYEENALFDDWEKELRGG